MNYFTNLKRVLNSYKNPLKKKENLNKKNALEKEFYDNIAEKHIKNFDKSLFSYNDKEDFPETHRYFYSHLNEVKGKKILDCCCGYGFTSVRLAKHGADIWGVDISPGMIELAQKNADFNKVSNKIKLSLMSVENLKFDDNTFDYSVGIGALHHLNLELAGKEISRVLKPGGKAFFIEPRIPFKWLIILRSVFPMECFESPGGSQLNDKDISAFVKYFSDFDINYFIFTKKFARFPLIRKFSNDLDRLDTKILKKIPSLKKFCWAFVIKVEK